MTHVPLRILAVMATLIAVLRLDPAPAAATIPSRATADAARPRAGSFTFVLTDRLIVIDATIR